MEIKKIKVKRLTNTAIIPTYGREGDAGFDFYSDETVTIPSKNAKSISTGIALEFPISHVLVFRDKSGLSFKHGLTVLGGVFEGTYRGDYKVHLYNTSDKDYTIEKGDKIIQGIILERPIIEFEEVDELSDSVRGANGFGSSGK